MLFSSMHGAFINIFHILLTKAVSNTKEPVLCTPHCMSTTQLKNNIKNFENSQSEKQWEASVQVESLDSLQDL